MEGGTQRGRACPSALAATSELSALQDEWTAPRSSGILGGDARSVVPGRDTCRVTSGQNQENVKIVEQMVVLFNEHGFAATRHFGHPEIEFHEPPEQPGARVARGIDEVMAFLAEFESAWQSHRTEPLAIRAVAEDKVLLETLEHFVGRDGMEVEAPFAGLYTFRDGKVLRWQAFWEKDRALEAAGLRE
jgi:ketosteroid isomerase-like protein